jgi:hypothetical protein
MKTENRKIEKYSVAKRWFLGLSVVVLFVCGIMVGVGISNKSENAIQWSESDCGSLKLSLRNAMNNGKVELIAELKKTYSDFCADVEEPKPVVNETKKSDESKETCQIIEEMLLEQLVGEDEPYVEAHEQNVMIYEKLVMNGCSENQMKYHKKIQREQEIMKALRETVPTKETCQQIEESLLSRLPYADSGTDADRRIERAKIYANLSERGCSQNSARYVELAKQELEIARALEDDKFEEGETIEVVETYKRLNMQAAAEEILDTVKKLTDPTIDFILQVEKIINQ